MVVASLTSPETPRCVMDHPWDSYIEVNDHVLILEGEYLGCTGQVTSVGAGGLLVVKLDPPEEHAPILISDAWVQLEDLAMSYGRNVMTTFERIDAALLAKGWRYDARRDLFFDGDKRLRFRTVVALIPGLTLDELASYRDEQYTQLCKRLVRPA
jgi:hypothetical protein